MKDDRERIGFACAYTPLALIHAAGFVPYRVLPAGDWPDQAGRLLHDNLCPHVKRILDRALQNDLPELSGMVFINSCDAMRRLCDAWRRVRPDDRTVLVDLPVTMDETSVTFFQGELAQLADRLAEWGGRNFTSEMIEQSIRQYNRIAELMNDLKGRVRQGTFKGGSAEMQAVYNRAVTEPMEHTLHFLEQLAAEPEVPEAAGNRVPVFLFGNVLPDPEVFSLIESYGARIVVEDLCTGSRVFRHVEIHGSSEPLLALARGLLSTPVCARTFDPARPGGMAEDLVVQARACGARGVIGHTAKFCDPYLARLPTVRDALRKAGLPFLLIEGDCTLRSMGQQGTRLEAFMEMLG